MKVNDYEHMLNLEINENESRKDFTKSERINYARQLEKIERMKAKERQGERNDITQNFGESAEATDVVAKKLDIGSGEQYRKEKYIAENVDFSEVAEKVNEISNIQKIETEIVVLKEQIAGNFIQVGQKLIDAKEEVEHGEWGEWLKGKVEFSHDQANRLMRIAREYPNSSAITNLSQTKVFSLLALPEEEREEFIENNPVEDMTTRELEKAIKEKKQLEKEKEQKVN